jgi:hypothetical protein
MTLSLLRRSDECWPERPASGRWIIATGDVVGATMPDALRALLIDADAVWVPHRTAWRACVAAGVVESALWLMPSVDVSSPGSEAATRFPRPVGGGTVFGLVIANDSELTVADALVRTWERAFGTRNEIVLRVVMAAAPTESVRAWHNQLLQRLSARAAARIDVWPTPIADDLWPAMVRSMDVLIAPGSSPSVTALWSLAASLHVPLLAPDDADGDVRAWVSSRDGFAIPVAPTGRFNWAALVAVIGAILGAESDAHARAESAPSASMLTSFPATGSPNALTIAQDIGRRLHDAPGHAAPSQGLTSP